MNISQYARFKGIHRDTVYEWLKSGKIYRDERGQVVEPEKPSWDKARWGKFTRKCPLCAGTGMVRGEKKSFKQMHDEAIIAAANSLTVKPRAKRLIAEMEKYEFISDDFGD